jgi:tRNA threonylcarbamoyladenosine biosynthesis protein TsaE
MTQSNGAKKEAEYILADESATIALGRALFEVIDKHCFQHGVVSVFLRGDLGMGKTTLTRGLLEGAGYFGNVKSPTYTIVEPYELAEVQINHFDLYRLGDPEELEFMGVRDYFEYPEGGQEKQLCILEWPDRGMGFLPDADFEVELKCSGRGRMCKIVTKESVLCDLAEVCEHNEIEGVEP